MKRGWIVGVGVLAALSLAALVAWRPAEPGLPSFPNAEVRRWTVREQGYSDGGPSVPGAICGARIWEPWDTALPKLNRDLTMQGFRKTSESPRFVIWKRADAYAMADAHWERGRPLVLTGVGVYRRASPSEVLAMKLTSAFGRR